MKKKKETITISKKEYEGMKATIEFLSSKKRVKELIRVLQEESRKKKT